jgi:hypothetical protein
MTRPDSPGCADDLDPNVRADAGGWISGPGLDVPSGTPASTLQDPDRLTIAR